MKARRVTIYRDANGEWRYHVQAGNWKIVEVSEEGFGTQRYARKRAETRWPGVEIVVEPT